MIKSIEIKGFRGIQEGKLEDLTPLVVLVGPNGSGKSTVLDAIYIVASPNPSGAIQFVMDRRDIPVGKGKWLILNAGDLAMVSAETSDDMHRSIRLIRNPTVPEPDATIDVDVSSNSQGGFQRIGSVGRDGGGTFSGRAGALGPISNVELLVSPNKTPLHRLYSQTVREGRKEEALAMVSELIPGIDDIEILTEPDTPVVYVKSNGIPVPVDLAGDGVKAALRISLDLALRPSGVVLLEEPEVHQHPRAIRQTARAMWAAVKHGVQVIMSTHSLELIDAIASWTQSEEELGKLSLYRLQLRDGCLRSVRLNGEEIAFSRAQIEDDLR